MKSKKNRKEPYRRREVRRRREGLASPPLTLRRQSGHCPKGVGPQQEQLRLKLRGLGFASPFLYTRVVSSFNFVDIF